MLAGWVWQRTARPPTASDRAVPGAGPRGPASWPATSIHAWAEAHYDVPVTAFTRYLPLYYPLRTTGCWRGSASWIERGRASRASSPRSARPPDGELHYPLAPLRCEPRHAHAQRPARRDRRHAGRRARRPPSRRGWTNSRAARSGSTQHYSGGNSSRAGMFSLFYGLPATYWDAFAGLARPPVLMDLFRQYGYQLGLFASSPVYRASSGSIARPWPACRTCASRRARPTRGPAEEIGRLTDEWYEWLDRRDPSRPFFGFLYYDSAVAIEPPDDYPPVAPVAAGSLDAGTPACPLPDRRALRRLPGRAGARRSEAPKAARPHRGHRHLRSRHGVRRERAGLQGARDGLQRLPAAHAAGGALARAAAGARRSPHLPQRRGADAAHRAVRLHESALRLREWAQPLLRRAVGLAHRRQPQRLRPDRARSGDHRLPVRLRDPRPELSPRRTRRSRATTCGPRMQEMRRFYR